MILGSGALGVRPLSDPVALPPYVIPPQPTYPHFQPVALLATPLRSATVLPHSLDGDSVALLAMRLLGSPAEGVKTIKASTAVLIAPSKFGAIPTKTDGE